MRHLSLLPALALPCLVAACDAPGADATANTGNMANEMNMAAANTAAGNMTAGNAVVANDANEATANEAAPPAPEPRKVGTLPLTRGFYVDSGTPCGEASNATLMLVRRDGYGGSRYACDFRSIEQTGPQTYRVTERCSSGGEAWGSAEEVETTTYLWQIPDATHFSRAPADGGEAMAARFCPQARLPDPWNTNDISDLTK